MKMALESFTVEGGLPLSGEVEISGAKNAALPILAACLLVEEGKVTLRNVPHLADVNNMVDILKDLGLEIERSAPHTLQVNPGSRANLTAPYEKVRKMRASFCVLGPLVASRGRARVSLPGGCVIGPRPVDLHIKGLRALGARIDIEHGYVVAECPKLVGAEIFLGGPFGSTVLGTANVMMAATLAEGTTVIDGAACEPEVADLASFLICCGARISGVGTPRIEIEGVRKLHGCEYEIIYDRIEAGTFLMAALITRGEVTLRNARMEHLRAVVDKLREIGADIEVLDGALRVSLRSKRLLATDVTTYSYPGFPTDLQAQIMALLSLADGISVITEKIYPDRFMHVAELNRMGARIRKEGPTAIVMGVPSLSGAPVMASDLRASAALVLAGLAARGKTEIGRVYHIDRGYERIDEKLVKLGARVERVER